MKNEEFDQLMQQFRAACVHTAEREYAAAQNTRRAAPAARRWMVAAASAVIAITGGVTALTLHHRGMPTAQPNTPQIAATPVVSDDALLSAVDEDLSDRVPQALAPLAVSYTSNRSATEQNQKEQTQ